MLCYAMLIIMLCYAILGWNALCYHTLRRDTSCYAMPYDVERLIALEYLVPPDQYLLQPCCAGPWLADGARATQTLHVY